MKKLITLLLFTVLTLPATCQESMFKALFMFNFAKYIEWPQTSNNDKFVIAILGNDDIESELIKLSKSKKVLNKSIIVKKVNSVSEASGAQILYISAQKSSMVNQVVSYFSGKPTLVIGDDKGLCKRGVAISYCSLNGKLKYEINKNSIVAQQLKVDQKLVTLGIEVQ